MSPGTISPMARVKALGCDVFGTVVDWRSTVTDELCLRAHRKLSSPLTRSLQDRLVSLSEEDWGRFAQEWRNMYKEFVRNFDPDKDAWKTVDQHHLDSLITLLHSWDLDSLFTPAEIESLSLVWHRLVPWPDSVDGLAELGTVFTTSTLSNGNLELLQDLNDFGSLGFQKVLSAENFTAYKPNPAVYLGAARELGLEPSEVAMVATHLDDLEAARSCGLRTVYIERHGEETRSLDSRHEAREWVDVWVGIEEHGFITLAQKLKNE